MAGKKEEVKLPIRGCLAPLPEGKRGYGIHINATSKGKSELGPRIIYGNGRCVVIRSLADPSKSEVFTGHKSKVNVAVFSPNGEWVASGDSEGTVLVWEASNKKIKNEVTACRNVLDITWDPEGKRIVAVGDGENMKAKAFAWDSQNNLGENHRTLQSNPCCGASSSEALLSCHSLRRLVCQHLQRTSI